MFDLSIGSILGFFGIGGVGAFLLGLAIKFGLGGALFSWLPSIIVKALSSFVEFVLRIVSWCMETLFSGTASIFSGDEGWKKGFAMMVFILVAGYVGDKYDPWRSMMAMSPSMIWNGASNRVSDEGDYAPPRRGYTQKSKTVYNAARKSPRREKTTTADLIHSQLSR